MTMRRKLFAVLAVLLAVMTGSSYTFLRIAGRRIVLGQAMLEAEALAEVISTANEYAARAYAHADALVGRKMKAQAILAAHLVAVAEGDAGMTSDRISAMLKEIADRATIDYIAASDSQGRFYIASTGDVLPFDEQEIGDHLRGLLDDRHGKAVLGPQTEDLTERDYRYAAVSGVDMPRIVKVGYRSDSVLAMLNALKPRALLEPLVGTAEIISMQMARPDGAIWFRTSVYDVDDQTPPEFDAHLRMEIMKAYATGRPQAFMGEGFVRVSLPVYYEEVPSILVMKLATTRFEAFIQEAAARVGAAGGVLMIVGLFLAMRLSGRIAQPIQELAVEAEEIGRGNLTRAIDVKGGVEVSVLAGAFNKMRESLRQHIDELKQVTAARERLQTEMDIAADVQASMLPAEKVTVAGVEVAAVMEPALEVGGDFYDVLSDANGCVRLVLGDISGKGLPGALFASYTLSALRSLGLAGAPVDEVLKAANRAVLAAGERRGMFATVFYAIYESASGRFIYASAGHPRPLFARSGRAIGMLGGESSLPLGVAEDFEPVIREITLHEGDLLIAYSDGVTEALDADGNLFGEERLISCAGAATGNAREIIAEVKRSVVDFRSGAAASDDMTLVALRLAKGAAAEGRAHG